MEKNSTVQKIIFGILDTLLFIGAVIGVLTIDGGKWIINNPAFYQPEENYGDNSWMIETQPEAAAISGAEIIPLTGSAGQIVSQPARPKWQETAVMLNRFHGVVNHPEVATGAAGALTVCRE